MTTLATILGLHQKQSFKLIAQGTNGFGLRRVEGFASHSPQVIPPFELSPRAGDIGAAFLDGHGFEVRKKEAYRIGCHKTFSLKNPNCMIERKGRDAKRFVPFHALQRRGQRWPMHCIGETYADHFLATLRCILSPFLLGIALVGSRQSSL